MKFWTFLLTFNTVIQSFDKTFWFMMKHHQTRFGYKRISSSADGQRGQTGFIFYYNLVKKRESILIQIKGYHLTKLERDVVFFIFQSFNWLWTIKGQANDHLKEKWINRLKNVTPTGLHYFIQPQKGTQITASECSYKHPTFIKIALHFSYTNMMKSQRI